MPRLSSGSRRTGKMDRPSRLLIFARRRRRMIRPVLFGAVLVGVAGFGLHVWHAMRTEAAFAPMRAQIGRSAGLRVTEIVVEGRNMTSESQLMGALGVSKGDALLGFSVEAARLRIDRLSFVEHSTIERRLPGTILVRLTERRPFAVWQDRGGFVLIDRQGQVVAEPRSGRGGMSTKDAEAFAELPLVVGAGANKAASALIDALAAEPVVDRQVVASVRVGQRRWNLTLRSGADVLLPEGEEVPALHRLAQLEDAMHLLERPLTDIDLRLADRLTIRPQRQASPDAGPDATPSSVGVADPGAGNPGIGNPGIDPPARNPAATRRPA